MVYIQNFEPTKGTDFSQVIKNYMNTASLVIFVNGALIMPFFLYYIMTTGKEMKKTSRVSLGYASIKDRRSSDLRFGGSSKMSESSIMDSNEHHSREGLRGTTTDLLNRKPTLTKTDSRQTSDESHKVKG